MFPRIPLKLKFILCIGSIIAISIGALFFRMERQSEDAIMDQVDRQARVLLQQVIVTRSWVADHGGVFVKEGPDAKANLGAVLHDIGKIGISDSVLRKPGYLDADEIAQMKTHPRKGVEIIASSEFLTPVIGIILHHHERYDGKGYPCGLHGEEIPIIARVLSVADTFDAMTTDRPYRPGLSRDAAVEEIRGEAGAQFDPKVVEAFLRACEKGALD